MNSEYPAVRCEFRFNKLNKLQAFTLEREVQNSRFSEIDNRSLYLGEVVLDELSLQEINDFYYRQNIDIKDCDICVTTTSANHDNIIDVPFIVNQMLKYIDCRLTYRVKTQD